MIPDDPATDDGEVTGYFYHEKVPVNEAIFVPMIQSAVASW
jgi:hypothetical protein